MSGPRLGNSGVYFSPGSLVAVMKLLGSNLITLAACMGAQRVQLWSKHEQIGSKYGQITGRSHSDSAFVKASPFVHCTLQPLQQLHLACIVVRQAQCVEACCCRGESLTAALDSLQPEPLLLS